MYQIFIIDTQYNRKIHCRKMKRAKQNFCMLKTPDSLLTSYCIKILEARNYEFYFCEINQDKYLFFNAISIRIFNNMY